jgi:hypothetical protein
VAETTGLLIGVGIILYRGFEVGPLPLSLITYIVMRFFVLWGAWEIIDYAKQNLQTVGNIGIIY